MSWRVVRLQSLCFLKVLDCFLMVAHVLIDKTSLDVNGLVIWHLFLDFRELVDSLVESVSSPEHQS
jgi:hypothetical protein